MRYRVWVQRRTVALENFVVDAPSSREAERKAIQEAERLPTWDISNPQLAAIDVDVLEEAHVHEHNQHKRRSAA